MHFLSLKKRQKHVWKEPYNFEFKISILWTNSKKIVQKRINELIITFRCVLLHYIIETPTNVQHLFYDIICLKYNTSSYLMISFFVFSTVPFLATKRFATINVTFILLKNRKPFVTLPITRIHLMKCNP